MPECYRCNQAFDTPFAVVAHQRDCTKKPRKQRTVKVTPYHRGTNPRAKGTNPRAKGTNPRAMGTNLRAVKALDAQLDKEYREIIGG